MISQSQWSGASLVIGQAFFGLSADLSFHPTFDSPCEVKSGFYVHEALLVGIILGRRAKKVIRGARHWNVILEENEGSNRLMSL